MRFTHLPFLLAAGLFVRSAMFVAPAAATSHGGLNLGWNDCGGLPASLNESFACDISIGFHTLVGGNRARIKALIALPAGDPRIQPVPQGIEVHSFKARIDNAKTTGQGSCAGCATGVCIVLNSIRIGQPTSEPGGNKFVSAPAVRSFATWQGGSTPDCYAATPVRNATWGSIKARYR